MIKLTMEIEIDPRHYDGDTMSWVSELVDKGREQGDVTRCVLDGIPTTLWVVGEETPTALPQEVQS